MKKSTLALAVAAALAGFGTVAQADTTLYGSARVSVDYNDGESTYLYLGSVPIDRHTIGNDAWDVFNNASRLGVRGEEDLGGGLSAIYQYEFGVDISEGDNFNGNRPKWVGLKGASWGSITAGTQWTPYYNVIGVGDIFNSSKVFDNDTYLGNRLGLRMDNSLIYSSPNWSGFSAQAMLVMDGTGQSTNRVFNTAGANLSDGVDLWNISASYKNGPFFAGATYMTLDDSNDVFGDDPDQWGLAFGYNAGPFALTLAYEDGDANDLYFGTSRNIYVTGQYTFGNNVVRASYGYLTPDDSRINTTFDGTPGFLLQEDINNFALGYQYNLSKRTRVWVEYMGRFVDDSHVAGELNRNIYGDAQTVSIGTRHDF